MFLSLPGAPLATCRQPDRLTGAHTTACTSNACPAEQPTSLTERLSRVLFQIHLYTLHSFLRQHQEKASPTYFLSLQIHTASLLDANQEAKQLNNRTNGPMLTQQSRALNPSPPHLPDILSLRARAAFQHVLTNSARPPDRNKRTLSQHQNFVPTERWRHRSLGWERGKRQRAQQRDRNAGSGREVPRLGQHPHPYVHLCAAELRALLLILRRLGEIQRSLRLFLLEELQRQAVLPGRAAPRRRAAVAREHPRHLRAGGGGRRGAATCHTHTHTRTASPPPRPALTAASPLRPPPRSLPAALVAPAAPQAAGPGPPAAWPARAGEPRPLSSPLHGASARGPPSVAMETARGSPAPLAPPRETWRVFRAARTRARRPTRA